MVYGHITSHGEDERCFTHGRAGCDDHQVGFLPSQGDPVQCGESGRYPMEAVLTQPGLFDQVKGSLNYRTDGQRLF